MNSITKLGAILSLTAVLTGCNAQNIKNAKTVDVKIYGNCEMCETTIEEAAFKKKIASADWSQDTKIASLTFDATQTSEDEILKRIAYAGYDNEKYLAPDDAYAKLPDCCKYERKGKKEVASSITEHKNDHGNTKDTAKVEKPVAAVKQLSALFDAYFELKNALVKSDSKTATAKANALLSAYAKVEMGKMNEAEHNAWMKEMGDVKKHTEKIASSKDIDSQRKYFSQLSENMYALAKVADLGYTVYKQHCPMYNEGANWLSKENAVKNPYYGSQMLTCGKTTETIK